MSFARRTGDRARVTGDSKVIHVDEKPAIRKLTLNLPKCRVFGKFDSLWDEVS
jgi:hypothetical protein